MSQPEVYFKFYGGEGRHVTTFYFYYPSLPKRVPRLGDCARPIGGEVFIPVSDSQVEEARAFAEERWGYTIKRDEEQWRFVRCGPIWVDTGEGIW